MSDRPTYLVIAIDAGSHIEVPGLPGALSQALTLEDVDDVARDAIALLTGVPPHSFDVDVSIEPFRR